MSKRGLIGAVVVIVVVVLGVVLWSQMRPTSPTAEVVRYGYLPIAPDASFFVAVDEGFFAAQGLQVELTKMESSNQALESLVAGRVDATAIVALEAALALEANTPGQFRITEMSAAGKDTRVHRIMVTPDSDIQSLAQLKGKRVGTFPGSQMMVFLKLILGQYFDADREVEIIQLKPPLQPQALESGQVDALFCLEPTGTLLEARGLGRAISVNPLYEYIMQPFPTAVGLVSSRLVRDNPDVVDKITAALRAAHEYLRSHPEEASLSLPRYTPIGEDLAPEIALYDYWDLESADRGAVQQLADLYFEKGILPRHVSTDGLYASSGK